MRRSPILLLVVFPLLVGGGFWCLDMFVLRPALPRPRPGQGDDIRMMLTVVGISALTLTLAGVPVLLASSYRAWRRGDRAWKWQLALTLPVELAGNVLTVLGTTVFSFYLVPLNLIVFAIGLLVVLVPSAVVNIRSAYFWLALAYTTVAAGLVAFVFTFLSRLSLCYCPVTRRSQVRDFLLRPLYARRRARLKRRLADNPVLRHAPRQG